MSTGSSRRSYPRPSDTSTRRRLASRQTRPPPPCWSQHSQRRPARRRGSDRSSTDQLPPEQWLGFQAQLIENSLVSRRATFSPQSGHVAVSALRASLLAWVQADHRFVWDIGPEDLDKWAVARRHSVATRTHTGYFAAVA